MEERKITYSFPFWGPFLMQTKVLLDELNQFKKLCNKKESNRWNKNLAGHFEDEFAVDRDKYHKLLIPYLHIYAEGYKNFYGKELKNKIVTKKAWVNYMKAGDFNPIHVHDCDFSSVLFIDIPNKLKDEAEKARNKGNSSVAPGAITFLTSGVETKHYTDSSSYFPTEGDLFIFPANLGHLVSPYKSKVTRISMAANYVLEK
jgi:predicted secreted protein